jgi:hypothetical protein
VLQVKSGLPSGRDDTELMTYYGPGYCEELIEMLRARTAGGAPTPKESPHVYFGAPVVYDTMEVDD